MQSLGSNPILSKLEKQTTPQIVFADIDGTLFSPDMRILRAPFFNIQTSFFLNKHHIPLVLVTGRSDWQEMDKLQVRLLGIQKPDAVIAACGSIMYERHSNNTYTRDLVWETDMQHAKIAYQDGKIETWNKQDITRIISSYLSSLHISYSLGQGNTFLIRIKILNYPVQQIELVRKNILALFPAGIRVVLTEKLLTKNSQQIFSGELLIVPKIAGKENAIKYFLEKYSTQIQKPIHARIFGDASVDVGMLSFKENPSYYTLSQYLVHPTPLAKKTIGKILSTHPTTHVLHGDGPKEIWKIITGRQSQLSPAQNNPLRKIVKSIEPFLDRMTDKNLSPNEISFLGLMKLSNGLEKIYRKNASPFNKIKGWYNYSFGQLTDVLDGIRARRGNKKEENGQLVDGFSDRAKEFMQLYVRSQKRLTTQSFLACLSCALPSIARAQAEITGIAVAERDEKGGSMIDRTKNLFLSLAMDTIGFHQKSYSIDQEIYSSNINTFKHRLSAIERVSNRSPLFIAKQIKQSSLSDFQKKALERWLEYIDVLQQEDAIIKKFLAKYPLLLKQYEKESQNLAKDYLSLPVHTLRKKWKIKDYGLQLKDYIK